MITSNCAGSFFVCRRKKFATFNRYPLAMIVYTPSMVCAALCNVYKSMRRRVYCSSKRFLEDLRLSFPSLSLHSHSIWLAFPPFWPNEKVTYRKTEFDGTILLNFVIRKVFLTFSISRLVSFFCFVFSCLSTFVAFLVKKRRPATTSNEVGRRNP